MSTPEAGSGSWCGRWLSVVLVACAALAAAPADAAFITVQPATASGEVGDRLAFEVWVGFEAPDEDEAPEEDELVSAFDFDLAFDPTVLSFDRLVFGTSLGLLDDVNSGASLPSQGVIDFFAFSILLDEELAALQPGGSVLLATLSFIGLAPGVSTVGVIDPDTDTFFLLIGPDLADLSVTANAAATATVTARPLPVPEPGTLALMGLGLLGIAGLAAARRQRC